MMKTIAVTAGILVAGMGFFGTAKADACSTGALQRAVEAPLNELIRENVDYGRDVSTEGAGWTIYYADDGSVRAIVLGIYHESSRTLYRLSPLTRRDFAITVERTDYHRPLFRLPTTVFAKQTTTHYFYCGDELDKPILYSRDETEQQFRDNAEDAKTMIFDSSPEIKPYLDKIKN